MSAVAKLTARWKFLGTSLGVQASNLDSILSATPHSLDDCLREMLLHWLRQIYDVRTATQLQPDLIYYTGFTNLVTKGLSLVDYLVTNHSTETLKNQYSEEHGSGSFIKIVIIMLNNIL